ncbi:MAG: VCBS repeat-containing protein [Deltaproteobacteria bacterium]|nr:VCBS repeat-containing protein [Deltaproteobacteria bacterium]
MSRRIFFGSRTPVEEKHHYEGGEMQNNLEQGSEGGRQRWSLRLLALVVLMAVGADAFGQLLAGPEPGDTDPLGKPTRYTLFPDHELLAVLTHDPNTPGTTPEFSFNSFDPSPDLKTLKPIGGATNLPMDPNAPHMVAGAGRILAAKQDQVVYARRTGINNIAVAFLGYPDSTTTLSPLADRFAGLNAELLDIAVGDLDKNTDSVGDNHEEVVVCWANTSYEIQVTVLDYTSPSYTPSGPVRPLAATTAKTTHRLDPGSVAAVKENSLQPVSALLACTIGDFDGDGQNEIAVVGFDNARSLWVSTLRYKNDGSGHRSLAQVSTAALAPPPPSDTWFAGSVDVAAGDFNGDGRDDLAVSYVVMRSISCTSTPPCHALVAAVVVVGSDRALSLTFGEQFASDNQPIFPKDALLSLFPGTQVVSGLFKFDPSQGFNFGRRQFVLVTSSNQPGKETLLITPLTVSNDLKKVSRLFGPSLANDLVVLPDGSSPNSLSQFSPHFSAVAGGFSGNGDINKPLWSLAIGFSYNNAGTNFYEIAVLKVESGLPLGTHKAYFQPLLPNFGRFPLLAYDADGDSVYLGAPIHLTTSEIVRTQAIFQEPPKHTAYLSGKVENLSRMTDFYVELKDSSGTTVSNTNTDTSDWNIGGSAKASAKATGEAGFDVGLAKTTLKTSVEVSGKVAYDYNGHKEDYNSQYAASTLTFTDRTDVDDFVVGELQIFDVWRYRGFGIASTDAQGNKVNGFYELVLPGPKIAFHAGGLSFDWYQPLHENGNILSYPALMNKTFTPGDLGSFTLPNGTVKTELLVPPQLLAYDGTSGTIRLDFSKSSGGGSTRNSSHTLKESADVKISAKATVKSAFGGGGSIEGSVSWNVHNSNSWSTLTTGNSTTNTSTGITLQKSSGDPSRAYNFAPVFYYAQDGTIKVVHAVDILGNAAGHDFWARTYGQKPDPALNLPLRFRRDLSAFTTTWLTNTDTNRKKIRGFFLRKAALNPVTNDYDYLAGAPGAGQKVRIETRVYNYSTAQAANNVKVRFQVIGFNGATATEIPFTTCPAGAVLSNRRCTIGETFVSLAPLAMQPVAITWDTTGFGPVSAGGFAQYHIYVVLDPDNTIDETYEDDSAGGDRCTNPVGRPPKILCNPGQNNEGYGEISIAKAALLQAELNPPHADVRLRKDAVAAIDAKRGTLVTGAVDAYVGQSLPIRVHVATDVSDLQQYHVLVFASDDQKQLGELIADKLIDGVDEVEGSYLWLDWTPTTLGKEYIRVQVLEKEDDVIPGNGKRVLKVRVKPVPKEIAN